jgi:membrane protein implicated in regulation of membrane protease activity
MDEPSPLIGCEGTVTVAIHGGNTPGEVLVPIRGGTETYLAYADEPIPSGTRIVVYDVRGGRRLGVAPLTPRQDPGGD